MKKNTLLKSTLMLIIAFIICFGAKAQVHMGPITLHSQAEVDAFNFTEVSGYLTILGSDITDLTKLSILTTVKGDLSIRNCAALASLNGLENITTVDGGLKIIYNDALTSISELQNITSVGIDELQIYSNPGLTSLNGLQNINHVVWGDVVIRDNDALTSITALQNITAVQGDLEIGNTALTSLNGLQNIISVGGDLMIRHNDALTSIAALKITAVGGGLRIDENDALTSITALQNINSLGDYLNIYSNAVITSLNGIQNIANFGGDINISDNDALTSITELQNITSVAGDLIIVFNDALTNLIGLQNITSVAGNLNIGGAALTSLVELQKLTSVGGFLNVLDNSVLTSLNGLQNLTSAGGIGIGRNDALTNLTELQNITDLRESLSITNNGALVSLNGLQNITAVGQNLMVYANPSLTSLTELQNITSVGGGLTIQDCDELTSLNGLQNLTSVGADLLIYGNALLTSLNGLQNLTSVGGNFTIKNNDALANFTGLENLTSVDWDLKIESNASLTSLTGLENLSSLRWLKIETNPLLTSLSGLENLASVHTILINDNDALTSLSGLENINPVYPGVQITIEKNDALTNLTEFKNLTSLLALVINYNNALISLDGLQNLNSIPHFRIVSNNALISLAGLENLASIGSTFTIRLNNVLTDFCTLYKLISGDGLSADYDVAYNAANPTKQEIIDNCFINTPPVAVCQNVTVPADKNCQAMVTATEIDNSSTDPDGDEISLSISPEGPFVIGVTNVTLTVDDGNGETATCEATVTVYDDIPPLITCPAEIHENSAPDQCGAPVNFIVTASDNCEGVTVLSIPSSGSNFPVGTTTVTSTATDAAGNELSCSFNVKVTDNTVPTVVTQDLTVQLDENGLSSIVPADIDNGSNDACGIASLSVFPNTFTCANLGNNTVTLTVTDVNGNSASNTASVTVLNDSPVIYGISAPSDPRQIETLIEVNATFTDNNLVSAEWDWGGQNFEAPTTRGTIVGNTITGSYQYSTPGVYSLTLTVTDMCGEIDVMTFQYIVIYDPNDGFVTGGGWINSPAGAYMPELSLEGKANFGFVSKYKKGSSVPDGNTEFQFKTGNLNFKSTDYEWLVIAGSKAMFKGSGTINGFGNYGFILSAIDADLTPSAVNDKFRIKIWDKDNNDLVVYDNNPEQEEDVDPSTEIGGGSIVIHKSKTKSAEIESDLITHKKSSMISVYPNPFNERLHFEFMCIKDVDARIDIYDITGRKVETVFDKRIAKDVKYKIDFMPTHEVSEIYIYRITLGESVKYGKVIYKKR